VGAGAVLTGLMKRAYPEVALFNLQTAASYEALLLAMAETKNLVSV
jgi:hypothetical protein